MKNALLGLFFIITTTISTMTWANNKVIYGADDRHDLYEITNPLYLELARSTAAMIKYDQLENIVDGKIVLQGGTLADFGMCPEERYNNYISVATCSGFLVGEDLLVTAGHCIQYASQCQEQKWVFDFTQHSANDSTTEYKIDPKDIYGCTEIIEHALDSYGLDDYALLRLDRKVTDRAPLKFRTSGRIADNRPLVVIGHPMGISQKITDGGNVRYNAEAQYFSANLDTYAGNSGSAVFDAETGLLEGILVRGETDYLEDEVRECSYTHQCSDDGCMGEEITRITNIKFLLQL